MYIHEDESNNCLTNHLLTDTQTYTCVIVIRSAIAELNNHIRQEVPYHNQCIKNIRYLLTQEATEILVLGTVMSHLDYCNGILVGLLDVDVSKRQCVQNIAAKMVVLNGTSIKTATPEAF